MSPHISRPVAGRRRLAHSVIGFARHNLGDNAAVGEWTEALSLFRRPVSLLDNLHDLRSAFSGGVAALTALKWWTDAEAALREAVVWKDVPDNYPERGRPGGLPWSNF